MLRNRPVLAVEAGAAPGSIPSPRRNC